MTFRDQHRELQEIVRELHLIRTHNLTFTDGDTQEKLLLNAEALLIILALERFLRIVVPDAGPTEGIFNLLQRGISRKLLQLPAGVSVEFLKDLRNAIAHGNFEQAAQRHGDASAADYFAHHFAKDIETLFQIVESLFKQIDARTGKPFVATGAPPAT